MVCPVFRRYSMKIMIHNSILSGIAAGWTMSFQRALVVVGVGVKHLCSWLCRVHQ